VVYANRGNVKYGIQDYPSAIADFTKAIELKPNEAVFYSNRGNAKSAIKDIRGAVADLKQAARLGDASTQKALQKNGIKW
jgi:tetratricopeptide (TPR) repeat protein